MNRASDKRRSLRALDLLAFLVPDAQTGVGPFLVVFMSSALHWNADRVGRVMFISALCGVILQTPAGALVDRARSKPVWIAAALVLVAASVASMALFPSYMVIVLAQSAIGAAGAVVAPALAAVSLGLVGRNGIDARISRNTALTAGGTVAWALCTGLVGRWFGAAAMFGYALVMAAPAIAAALSIRNVDVDPALARGADHDESGPAKAHWHDRRLTVLCACAFLFHLANAAMLTLAAQEISAQTGSEAPVYMSASLIITQLMTMAISFAVGRYSSRWPRKPVFLAGFAVLPLRAALYLLSADPDTVVALQLLDGIGAGVFAVMQLLMVADITRGSGNFNLGQGIVATAVGIGAALSNLLAGAVVDRAGYASGFSVLGTIAMIALLLFATTMPETRRTMSNPLLSSRAAH